MQEKGVDIVRACALLHDVGKPRCWALGRKWSSHIDSTYSIVRESFGEELAGIAKRHHSGMSYRSEDFPQTDVEKVICLADNLSSGADRREEPIHGSPLPKSPFRLSHVLSRGDLYHQELDAANLEYMTQGLVEEFKKVGPLFAEDSRVGYLKLFDVMEKSRLKDVPADTRSPINDVCLWDHLKLTAAFASCMWLDGGYRGNELDRYEFALISGDADRISSFVNVSSRLPDLNARSERIRLATEDAAASVFKLLGPECLIFAGGGGVLAVAPVSMADRVCEGIKDSFESVMNGLVTITVSYVKVDGLRMQKEFGGVWKEAQGQMRLRKSERLAGSFEVLDEEARVCDVCHVRSVAHEDVGKILPIDASPRPERLCEFCWQLRAEGRGVGLDSLRKRSNLMGLFRADGDGVGKVLGGKRLKDFGKVATPSRLSTVSRQIHGVCEERLGKVVSGAGGRCLIAGGDDVLAIVPGEEALETARRLAAEFKREMAEACTMSVGVALFRYDLPIYIALEASEKLLHLAKEEEGKDSVAFAIVGGVGLTPEGLGAVKHGPMKWSMFDEVLRLSSMMGEGGVASSQLRRIAQAARRNSVFARALIESLMGKFGKGTGLEWSEGQRLISDLESGIVLDAFAVYSAFKNVGEVNGE